MNTCIINQTKNLAKGCKLAEKFYNKAKQERDKKGYRENLGYDSLSKFKSELDKIIDQCEYYKDYSICIDYFNSLCDRL